MNDIGIALGAIRRCEVVPLEGLTMGEWYKRQGDKPRYMINASLYNGSYKNPIGTIIYGGKMVKNSGSGWGFGVCGGVPGFGTPWDKKWDCYITGYPATIKAGAVSKCGSWDKSVTEHRTKRSMVGMKGEVLHLITEDNITVESLTAKLPFDNLINLDGGGSSRLYIDGVCINKPTDNRRITNIIAVWVKEEKMRAIAKQKIEVLNALGRTEAGRYIDKGDVCEIGEVTANMLIPVTYPIKGGKRTAYVRSLDFFALG